jgi:hypothetical protein
MEQRSSGGGSSIPVVAIIAIVALVLFFAWFFMVRDSNSPATATEVPSQTDSGDGVKVTVDLPDSVVITP